MSRVIEPFKQFLDGNGAPLVDGWLRFLESGTNNTDKDTYYDVNLTLLNTNPLQLDSEGRCPDVFGVGSYRVVSYTNDLVGNTPAEQIQVKDPVPGTSTIGTQFGDWDAISAFQSGDIVADGGSYFLSLQNNNISQATTDATYWQKINFVYTYNSNAVYTTNQLMLFTDNSVYTCLSDTLAGQTPITHPDKWGAGVRIFKNVQEIEIDHGVLTGGTYNFDLEEAGVGYIAISTATQTLTFTNVGTTGFNSKFELHIINGVDQEIVLPANTKYANGTKPTFTALEDVLIFEFNGDATAPIVYVSGQGISVPV